jgi:hypothetical protein
MFSEVQRLVLEEDNKAKKIAETGDAIIQEEQGITTSMRIKRGIKKVNCTL